MSKEQIQVGDVVKVNIFDKPCVIVKEHNIEWVGYEYFIVSLDKMIEIGDFENSLEDILIQNCYRLSAYKIRDKEIIIEKLENEAPFEITKVPVMLHSCRRKRPKTVTVWE